MRTPDQRNGCVRTGTTGWISIRINDPDGLPTHPGSDTHDEAQTIPPALIHLFEHAEKVPVSLPERFPRLACLAIAIALLLTVLTAEFDYLRGAGYFWH